MLAKISVVQIFLKTKFFKNKIKIEEFKKLYITLILTILENISAKKIDGSKRI